jgi:hypothetical protein
LAVFTQELLRRHEERILLENAADDNQWVRPHDVNHRVTAKFSKLVGADDRILVALPHIIDTRFELKSSTAQSIRQQMRLSGNPPVALPLAICSNAASIRS